MTLQDYEYKIGFVIYDHDKYSPDMDFATDEDFYAFFGGLTIDPSPEDGLQQGDYNRIDWTFRIPWLVQNGYELNEVNLSTPTLLSYVNDWLSDNGYELSAENQEEYKDQIPVPDQTPTGVQRYVDLYNNLAANPAYLVSQFMQESLQNEKAELEARIAEINQQLNQ